MIWWWSTSTKMYLPLSLLICVSVIQLSVGDQPVEEIIKPRTAHRTGAWSRMSPESVNVGKAAHHAVKMFNTNSKTKKMFKLLSITAAQAKATNVINYKIDTVLGKTKCLKSENHALDSCNLDKKQVKCHFKVTFNPRNNTHEMLKQRCKRSEEKI